jgi:hypothetical protein
MNLYNVSGEGLNCLVCTTKQNNKCADPISSGLEPTTCSKSALEEGASLVRKDGDVLSNFIKMPDISTGSDSKFACQKIIYSGKIF